jgi:hypothetical protein
MHILTAREKLRKFVTGKPQKRIRDLIKETVEEKEDDAAFVRLFDKVDSFCIFLLLTIVSLCYCVCH